MSAKMEPLTKEEIDQASMILRAGTLHLDMRKSGDFDAYYEHDANQKNKYNGSSIDDISNENGDDTIGNDSIEGGHGNDSLEGGSGTETVTEGEVTVFVDGGTYDDGTTPRVYIGDDTVRLEIDSSGGEEIDVQETRDTGASNKETTVRFNPGGRTGLPTTGPERLGVITGTPYNISDKWSGTLRGKICLDASWSAYA